MLPAMPVGYVPSNFLETELLFTKRISSSDQGRATGRSMPFVDDRDIVDGVTWVSFGNLAIVMPLDGATAYIADAGDRFAIHCKVVCAYTHDLAAVGCGVTEADHIGHRSAFSLL